MFYKKLKMKKNINALFSIKKPKNLNINNNRIN